MVEVPQEGILHGIELLQANTISDEFVMSLASIKIVILIYFYGNLNSSTQISWLVFLASFSPIIHLICCKGKESLNRLLLHYKFAEIVWNFFGKMLH